MLTDFEDVSPEAVAAWRQTGMAHDAAPVPQRPQERQAWMRFKSQTLTRFTLDLRQAVQAIRGPQVKTARNLFALPILEPQSEAWFAQNLDDFLAAYDWTVPMAMPLMESVPIDASQAWLTRLVQAVLSVCRAPLVLDADGINAVAAHIDVLRGCACPVVLTPHDGEFLRLGGDPKAADRTQEAMRLADRTHAVLLLKGSRTVITDGLNVYVNHTGNPGLAAGGSGDVLAGMLVSLLGQHIMPLEAAAAAAWLHGSAADLAAQELGEYGMVPEDLLLRIPRLLP